MYLFKVVFFFCLLAVLSLSSCRSHYETVRTSNDPPLILKEADRYYEEGENVKAQALYELVIPFYRGKTEAEGLFYNYANAYYRNEEYILASHYFKQFAQTFYNSDKKEEAAYMSAYSNYHLSPNKKLDQTFTTKAIEGFQEFINSYPKSPRVDDCNKLIDQLRLKLEEKAFAQGQLYYKIGQYQAALKSFEIMLKDYPESQRVEEVRMLMLKSAYILAQNSYVDKKQERYEHALVIYNDFARRHPKSKMKKEAEQIFVEVNKALEKFRA